jgi:hypothetical protein
LNQRLSIRLASHAGSLRMLAEHPQSGTHAPLASVVIRPQDTGAGKGPILSVTVTVQAKAEPLPQPCPGTHRLFSGVPPLAQGARRTAALASVIMPGRYFFSEIQTRRPQANRRENITRKTVSMSHSRKPSLEHVPPWLAMTALIVLAYGINLGAQWSLAGHDLKGFIGFYSKFVDPSDTIPAHHISDEFGYDGQFYYRLALDPLSSEERVHGIRFDSPALRHQRILLPAVTWLVAQGDPGLSAVVMLTLNLLAVSACALAGAALLSDRGLSPWPALLLAFYPGFAISVERFLSEPMSAALLLSSLLLLTRKHLLMGGIALALAVVARETALVAALAMALAWCTQVVLRRGFSGWRAPGPLFWAPAIAVYFAWQTWLWITWQASVFSTATPQTLGWPLIGLVESLKAMLVQFDAMNAYFLCMLLIVLIWTLLVAKSARNSTGPWPWMWLAYLVFATLLGKAIWDNSPGFLRVTTELNLLGMVLYLLSRKIARRWVFATWAGCWLMAAGAEAYRLHLINQVRPIAAQHDIAGRVINPVHGTCFGGQTAGSRCARLAASQMTAGMPSA